MERLEKARLPRSPGAAPERSWSLPAVAADTRLRYAGICVTVALAAGMLLSPALWLSRSEDAPLAESFPMVPPISGLGVLAPPAPLDSMLYIGTLVLCALAAVVPRRTVLTVLFLACVLLALPDMLRWQPWFYLYLGAIGTLAFVVPQEDARRRTRGRVAQLGPLQVLRLVTASVYLYSGLNKVNAAFFEERLGGFLAGMPDLIAQGPVAAALTYSAPFIEMAAGVGLLVGDRRVRNAALLLAVSTNLFVLSALVASAANTVVWPWNAAMILLVTVLFAGRDEKAPADLPRAHRGTWRLLEEPLAYLYAATVVVLFSVMPILGLLGYWPSYLSFALYSKNTPSATVYVHGSEGRTSVTEIAYKQMNVPAYPSEKIYLAVGERSCKVGQPSGPVLVIRSRPDILGGDRAAWEYTCAELGREDKDPGQPRPPG